MSLRSTSATLNLATTAARAPMDWLSTRAHVQMALRVSTHANVRVHQRVGQCTRANGPTALLVSARGMCE